MIKKYSKIFIFVLGAFFISSTVVSAKTMDFDGLVKAIEEFRTYKNEQHYENATGETTEDYYVYISGQHVFMSDHTLTMDDTRAAGWTGGLELFILSKKDGKFDPSTFKVVLGEDMNAEAPTEFDIVYFDRYPFYGLDYERKQAGDKLNSFLEQDMFKKEVPGTEKKYNTVLAEMGVLAKAFAMLDAEGIDTEEEFNTAVENAKQYVIDELNKEIAYLLETVYNEGNPYQNMVLSLEKYNSYSEQLTTAYEAGDVATMIKTYEKALEDRYDATDDILTQAKEDAKDALDAYIDSLFGEEGTATKYKPTELDTLVEELKDAIDDAANTEALEALNSTKKIDKAVKTHILGLLTEMYNDEQAKQLDEEREPLVLPTKAYEEAKSALESAEDVTAMVEVLNTAKEKRITEQQNDLNNFKADAIERLKKYNGGAENYTINALLYEPAIKNAEEKINAAENIQDAIKAEEEARKTIDHIQSDLSSYKFFKKEELSTHYDGLDQDAYSESQKEALDNAKQEALDAISEALDKDAVDVALANGIKSLDEIPTAKEEAKVALNTYAEESLADKTYTYHNKTELVQEGLDAIEAAENATEVEAVLAAAKEKLNKYSNESIDTLRQQAVAAVESTTSTLSEATNQKITGDEDYVTNLYETVKGQLISDINAEVDPEVLESDMEGDTYVREAVYTQLHDHLLSELKKLTVINEEGKVLPTDDYETALNEIKATEAKHGMNALIRAYNKAVAALVNFENYKASQLETFKEKLSEILASKIQLKTVVPSDEETTYGELPEVKNIKDGIDAAFEGAKTFAAIEAVKEDIESRLLTAVKNYVNEVLDKVLNDPDYEDGTLLTSSVYNTAKSEIKKATTLKETINAFNVAMSNRSLNVGTFESKLKELGASVEVEGNKVTITQSLSQTLTIEDNSVVLEGTEGQTLTGDVKISADNVVVRNIEIEGNIVVTGKNVELENVTKVNNVKVDANSNVKITGEDTEVKNDNGNALDVAKGGKVTIEAGKFDATKAGKSAIANEGTVTIKGGEFTRKEAENSFYTFVNHGDMTIDGEEVIVSGDSKNGASLIENGYYSHTTNNDNRKPTLTINKGTFTGGLNTVKNDEDGTLIINGGEFSNVTQAIVLNWNIAEINGGKFDASNIGRAILLAGRQGIDYEVGKLTITAGDFTLQDAESYVVERLTPSNNPGTAIDGSLTIDTQTATKNTGKWASDVYKIAE